MKKRLNLIALFIFMFLLLQTVSLSHEQGVNDRIVQREHYTIKFPNGGPDLQFFLKQDENDSQTRFRYTLKWSKLIEYTDVDENGLYDKLVDTEVSTLNLATLNFNMEEVPVNLTNEAEETVTGKHFEFYANFTQNSVQGSVGILVGWWNGAVKHPYGSTFIDVREDQSKYIFVIGNWAFEDTSNRLAFLVDIVSSTPVKNYHLINLPNGTFGMLTKSNEDGKGHRGGIIDNPGMAILDGEESGIKTSAKNNGVTVDLIYNFPSFASSLVYDPTYSAVVSDGVPDEFLNSDINTSASSTTTGVPGFEWSVIVLSIIFSVLIIKKKSKKLQ